jgi:aspartate 1-decarboxylase
MLRRMLKSKIHRATVTQADLDYVGSIEISEDLMEASDIILNEQVHVWNITTGQRFKTYAIPGPKDSGVVCINGAAAHRANQGDLVIIASFIDLPDEEAKEWDPKLIFVDNENCIVPPEEVSVCPR